MGFFDIFDSNSNNKKKKKNQQGILSSISIISEVSSDMLRDTSKAIKKQAKRYGKTISEVASGTGEIAKFAYEETAEYISDLKSEYASSAKSIGKSISYMANKAGETIKIIYLKVQELITLRFLKVRTKIEVPEAARIQIMEAKKDAVKVGIFDEENHKIGESRYESSVGVDPSIHAGYKKYEIFS